MTRLTQILTATLTAPVQPDISTFIREVIGARQPLGVLFYGAGLRAAAPDALLDFYVIVEDMADWGWPNAILTAAGRLLPPNVVYTQRVISGRAMHAKIAVLTHAQFMHLTRRHSSDTSVWARFCQPSRLVWVRDAQAADRILDAVCQSVTTAAWWAACFSRESDRSQNIWARLFIATYRNELRPESQGRAYTLLQGQTKWFEELLHAAWAEIGLPTTEVNGQPHPVIPAGQRRRMRLRWRRMRSSGRWRNAARLCKAAFTYTGGADYLVQKIAKHHGLELHLSLFARQHPILCLPVLLWRARDILLRR